MKNIIHKILLQEVHVLSWNDTGILRESNSVVKKETFTNKFGEDMTLVLNNDGTILFKHEDYKNEYIPLDKLYTIFGFTVILDNDELKFFNNFIKGTRYQPVKSKIGYKKG